MPAVALRGTPSDVHAGDDATSMAAGAFTSLAGLLLGLSLALRAWVAGAGWFYADDLATLGRVHRTSFLDTVTYGEGGHVAYVGNALGWVTWRLMGFQWVAHVAWMMLGFTTAALLLLWLLIRLFGRRPGVLVCWTLFLLSSAMAPSLMWLSQSSIVWGVLIPSLATSHAFVSYAVSGARRWLVALAAFLWLGLLMTERTVLMVPQLLILLTVCMWRLPAYSRLKLGLPATITIASIIPYLAYYSATAGNTRSAPLGLPLLEALTMALHGMLHVWIPTMLGGPWFLDKTQLLPRAALENPMWLPALLVLIALVVLGALRSGTRGLLAAVTVLAFGALDVLGVVWARQGSLGAYATTEWRYYSQASVAVSIALAIMFVTPAGRTLPRVDSPFLMWATRVLLLGTVIAVSASSILMARSMRAPWASSPARDFLSTTLRQLEQVPRPSLVDRQLPSDVIPPLLTNATRASWVLAGALPRPTWDRASTDLLAIDDSGHLVPVEVNGGSAGLRGPYDDCGWRIEDRPVRIPLADDLFAWNWVIELGYLSSGWMSLPIEVNGERREMPVARGIGLTQIPFVGPVDGVTLGPVPDGASLCVDRVLVGEPSAAKGNPR